MKLRTDFVTNSSSSSFIFGKIGDNTTVDVVYNIIRSYYLELLEKMNVLRAEQEKYSIQYEKTEDGFIHFRNVSEDQSYDYERKISDKLEKKYGFSLYDYIRDDLDWLSCETYEAYQNYWMNRIKGSEKKKYAPFVIVGQEQKTYVPFYYSLEESENPIFDIEHGELFDWYVPCKYTLNYYENPSKYDNENSYCDSCYLDKKACKKFISGSKKGSLTKDNVIAMTLGTVAILSECGYIPDYVVERLMKLCNYGCNHMG